MTCVYCGGPWNEDTKRMEHTRTCYIETGHLTVVAAKRAKEERERRKALPVKPLLDLDEDL